MNGLKNGKSLSHRNWIFSNMEIVPVKMDTKSYADS